MRLHCRHRLSQHHVISPKKEPRGRSSVPRQALRSERASVNLQRVRSLTERVWFTVCSLVVLGLISGVLKLCGFWTFSRLVSKWPTRRKRRPSDVSSDVRLVSESVDIASAWWPVRPRCLRRAAAGVCLLRLRGVPADLVIGIQPVPFAAHAWAEVGGMVVIEQLPTLSNFRVIERC